MTSNKNIFSQALQSALEGWKYFFGFVAASFAVEVVDLLFDLGTGAVIAKGFVEAGIVFYICVNVLALNPGSKDVNKTFTGFSWRYFLLLYGPVILLTFAAIILALSGSSGDDREIALGVSVVIGTLAYLFTMFLFGTALPSKLLGLRPEIGAAVGRSFRHAGYLLPRIFLGVGGLMLLSLAVLLVSETLGVGSDPVTSLGAPDVAGGVVLAVVKLLSGFSLALFAVIVSRAYLTDLQQKGELRPPEADVFS